MDFSPENFIKLMIEEKVQTYRELNRCAVPGQIVMAGSSLMEQFPINELMMNLGRTEIVYNRGMSAFTTAQYMDVLDACVLELKPSKVFINIGTNDIGATADWRVTLVRNYREILTRIQKELPACRIFVMAYYPVADTEEPFQSQDAAEPRTLENVHQANQLVEKLAEELGLEFISINEAIETPEGYLRSELAKDPVHMWPGAYRLLLEKLIPYFET